MGAIEEAAPCWRMVCDVCGEEPTLEEGGYVHFASRNEAEAYVSDRDWRQHDGFWACENCVDGALDEAECPVCQAAGSESCHRAEGDGPRWFYGPHDARVDVAVAALQEKAAK